VVCRVLATRLVTPGSRVARREIDSPCPPLTKPSACRGSSYRAIYQVSEESVQSIDGYCLLSAARQGSFCPGFRPAARDELTKIGMRSWAALHSRRELWQPWGALEAAEARETGWRNAGPAARTALGQGVSDHPHPHFMMAVMGTWAALCGRRGGRGALPPSHSLPGAQREEVR
jgi:hypothetical protein